jgi:hypothetical protein
MKDKKIILHLCADIGSDSLFYHLDPYYEVIKVGIEIGVENYHPPPNVYGVLCNPVCTHFSIAVGFHKQKDIQKGMYLVDHCFRIMRECEQDGHKLKFWHLENPATGKLKDVIGPPRMIYQPWEFGSPWTKKTALWGNFNIPETIYKNWNDVPKNDKLYIRGTRKKPGLVYFHKSAVDLIPEFQWAREFIKVDSDIRSMCSQGFAKAFYEANK